MIYHYTSRASAAAIIREGLIRAFPVPVFADFFGPLTGADPELLSPAVWFTTCEACSPTIGVRLLLDHLSPDVPGTIWRFGVADDLAGDLIDWAEPHNYSPGLFVNMISTAKMAGEDWSDWRLSGIDIPREKWLLVQSSHHGSWIQESH